MRQMTNFDDYYDDLDDRTNIDRGANYYHRKNGDITYRGDHIDYNMGNNAYTNKSRSIKRNKYKQPVEIYDSRHNRVPRMPNEIDYKKNHSLVSLIFLVILIVISFVLLNSDLGQYAAVTLLIAVLLFFGKFMSGGRDR